MSISPWRCRYVGHYTSVVDYGLIHWHVALSRHVLGQLVCILDYHGDYFDEFGRLAMVEDRPRAYPCTAPYRI